MRTTFDSEADAAYITLVPKITPGSSVRNVITHSPDGAIIALDFDRNGILLGVEVLDASTTMHPDFLTAAERLDAKQQ